MKSIIYVGMDVNKASFTLSCFSVTTQETFATVKMSPDAKAIKKYLDRVSLSRSEECEFVCGNEAGCLGYTLYHQLTAMNIRCVIMAPTTMLHTLASSLVSIVVLKTRIVWASPKPGTGICGCF